MSGKRAKAKFRLGERVNICVPGTIEKFEHGMVNVRIVGNDGEHNRFVTAVCYQDELRHLTAKGRGK